MGGQVDPFEGGIQLPKIVAVAFQPTGHLHNYLAGELVLRRGDRVLVDSDSGERVGTIIVEPHEPAHTLDLSSLKQIRRLATITDLDIEENNLLQEARARRLCVERIHERHLQMKLVTAEYTLDARKVTFYFIAEGRIDFRDLVRDLANTLRIRVDMKQIGARDETKVTGGVGPCGRELCCSSWLRDFDAVTVKMAREQGLALNPSRLAGMCGRLKCCLKYEYATYVELKRALPNQGKRVQSVKGDGKVIRQNILKQTVAIQLDNDAGVVEVTLEDLVDSRNSEHRPQQ